MDGLIRYPTVDSIIETHDKVIDESGGSHGLRDLETLKSIVEFIQHDFYYPTFNEKLCHLIYSINKNHVFVDGNKRASLSAGAAFMMENGWAAEQVDWYLIHFEDIVVWLADNKINKDLLLFALKGVSVRFSLINLCANDNISIKERMETKNKVAESMNETFRRFEYANYFIKLNMPNVLLSLNDTYKASYSKSYYYINIIQRILSDVVM